MKTKFILHGGFTFGEKQENDGFFKEILRYASNEANILLVYFAKEADRIEKNRTEDIEQFIKNQGGKKLSFQVASEEFFSEQVAWADVVYLHGGVSTKILETLKQFQNLKSMLEGKIVAGDSAGANVLSTAFYSQKADDVFLGFALLPVKLICHYQEKFRDKLVTIKPELETVCLPEYQFRVFHV